MSVYVLLINHDYEGCRPPAQAFRDEAVAQAALALVRSDPAAAQWELYLVPEWPEPAGEPKKVSVTPP